ncbi:MAG: nucleoside-diphosphate sugar epimerase/dehydratase [Armatimonadota bacterium]|nr:polysaccharide biosynthesis protein [bacterium]
MNEETARVFRRIRSRAGLFLLVCGDLLALTAALFLSLWLHYDNLTMPQVVHQFFQGNLACIVLSLCLYLLVFHVFRLYKYAWRFASLETVAGVVGANTIGIIVLLTVQYALKGHTLHLAVTVIFWMLSIALVGGVRVLLRMASLSANYGRGMFQIIPKDIRPRRVIILGGGSTGARLLRALMDEVTVSYDVIGFLDDSPDSKGQYIRKTRVLGPLRLLHKFLDEKAVDEVLIALPQASGIKIREYVMACRKKKVPVKIIPGMDEVLSGHTRVRLEEISVEDLLRRPPVRINLDSIGDCLGGARVMVTGAGGSIGSELCRQIMALDPATLVLLGHGENSIHHIFQELSRSFPGRADRLRVVIASVSDDVRMDQVFRAHRPHVVFHAAAHKHVPIMESNLLEAVQNNVLGTHCVAECCGRYGTQKMVLISTDKAVAPSSVMGATKWLCEEAVRAMDSEYASTDYVTVRFGNVLGSRGSVVPIFHEAIMRREPVCVTDPEMTRFFMSIPEAVQLVLQAGAAGDSGDLYVLDMGDPVRIVDLACDMIRLCGYEPNVDIPIIYTGMRPGEKLHEALTTPDEIMQAAPCDGLVSVLRPQYFVGEEMTEVVNRMRKLIVSGNTVEMRSLLEEVVPGFATPAIIAEAVPISEAS